MLALLFVKYATNTLQQVSSLRMSITNKGPFQSSIALTLSPLVAAFCRPLITFANSMDPDQARQNVGPDLDPNCLTLMVFRKDF